MRRAPTLALIRGARSVLCTPLHPSRHRNRRRWVRHQRRSLACSRSHAAPHRYVHRVQGGILPLQYATTHQASKAVLRMLLDAHPEAGDAMDEAAEAAGELSQLPKAAAITLTLTGTLATFDTAEFQERLATRLGLQVQQIKVRKVRPKSHSANGIAVEVDEDSYLRCTGEGSLSDGAEASEDAANYIASAIQVALKPIKVAKDAITR